MKKFLKWFLILIVVTLAVFYISGNGWVIKALIYNYVNIDDYTIFENREVKANNPRPWNIASDYNKKEISDRLKKQLEENSSVAFLIIKNDSIRYEKYWRGYSDSSLSSSFSMAKSIVGIMIGIALDERKIKSLDEPVANYIPEFAEGEKAKITIRHLLMMSSGLDWDEGYTSLFSPVTEAYYGKDLYRLVANLKVKEPPGKFWEYKSCDTQLLGFILEKATGKSLCDYCAEKIWAPVEAVHDALWGLDKKGGHEKAYSSFSSNARDFARLGKLYMQKGNWSGRQLVDTNYIEQSTQSNLLTDKETTKANEVYGYQWWVYPNANHKIFYARGILGQYVIVIPDMKIIIVRLGEKRSTDTNGKANDYPIFIEEVIKMYTQFSFLCG
jgi:CubicO group peptidase (beta-lactamase class C family)